MAVTHARHVCNRPKSTSGRKTLYLVHVCSQTHCPGVTWFDGAQYTNGVHAGFHQAFVAACDWEGWTFDNLQPGERVHVFRVRKDNDAFMGERFFFNKPMPVAGPRNCIVYQVSKRTGVSTPITNAKYTKEDAQAMLQAYRETDEYRYYYSVVHTMEEK